MILYLATNFVNLVSPPIERAFGKALLDKGYPYNRLVSFWFYKNDIQPELVKRTDPLTVLNLKEDKDFPQKNFRIMLDSGAYSMYVKVFRNMTVLKSQDDKLTRSIGSDYSMVNSMAFRKYLSNYIRFIHEHDSNLECRVTLDVIGSPEMTWEIFQIFRSEGITPMPVLHVSEDFKWLKKYMDITDYIAIGGAAKGMPDNVWKERMGNPVFKVICDSKGEPRVKVHGLAVSSPDMVYRYPWYSVDSSSWVQHGMYGMIAVPRLDAQGNKNYLKSPLPTFLSLRSKARKVIGSRFFGELGQDTQRYILNYIEEKGFKFGKTELREVPLGTKTLKEGERWAGRSENGHRRVEVTIEQGLENDHIQRDVFNVMFYLDMVRFIEERRANGDRPWMKTSGIRRFV